MLQTFRHVTFHLFAEFIISLNIFSLALPGVADDLSVQSGFVCFSVGYDVIAKGGFVAKQVLSSWPRTAAGSAPCLACAPRIAPPRHLHCRLRFPGNVWLHSAQPMHLRGSGDGSCFAAAIAVASSISCMTETVSLARQK